MTAIKRGFLKYYILKLLSEEPLTGYGLMKRIEEETGFWKPSTGSVYPLLQALEEQGWVTHEGEAERKVYKLTEAGRKALEEAHQAKEEILDGLQRAFEIFRRVFGPGEEEIESFHSRLQSLLRDESLGSERIPKALQSRIILLRHVLLSLPYEKLSEEDLDAISRVLEETLDRLSAYIEP